MYLKSKHGACLISSILLVCSPIFLFGCSQGVLCKATASTALPIVAPTLETLEPSPLPAPDFTEDIALSTTDEVLSLQNPTVYDFAVLTEDVFPRGRWTITQLIGKYGNPDDIRADYLPDYNIVWVTVWFPGFRVHFFPSLDAEEFSFYRDGLEEESYPINENDMDIDLEVLSLVFTDATVLFPYDIRITQNTKVQIVNLYSEDPVYQWKSTESNIDLIQYNYAFNYDNAMAPELYSGWIGHISYLFDKNEILAQVEIAWSEYDL